MNDKFVIELIEERVEDAIEWGLADSQVELLFRYAKKLVEANTQLNLFSRKMTELELVENHLFDCLMGLPYFNAKKFGSLADLGSGGGMPGVLLAIAFPDKKIVLFEKSPKKRKFLEEQASYIKNIKVEGSIDPSFGQGIDLVTARAFKPIEVIIKMTPEYFNRGGEYLLYKARKETIEKELESLDSKLKYKVHAMESPYLEVERNMVELSKK